MSPFQRVTCITMKRRQDRWERFSKAVNGWCLGSVERVDAIDGSIVKAPDWWKQGAGAWGCYRSHLRIIEECLNSGVESCLLLEDDAVPCLNFNKEFASFWSQVPSDWAMVYLGGQHLHAIDNPPIRWSDDVYIPFNVNRTHAFAIRGRENFTWVYKHLSDLRNWKNGHHIDHSLGRLHQRRTRPIYAPNRWLIGQDEGLSNINHRDMPRRYWPSASEYRQVKRPLVIVLGVHRSGSSCLAMMLHKLGVSMGDVFVGAENKHGGSGEAQGLASVMEAWMPFPALEPVQWTGTALSRMLKWVRARHEHVKGPIGAKYPHLCMMAERLEQAVGPENLLVVHARRPLSESVESLQRREPGRNPAHLRVLQENLHAAKQDFLKSTRCKVLHVDYDRVLSDPARVVDECAQFLALKPSDEQRAHACAHARPEHRSVAHERAK